jgi:tetratricopeptide (TPR) repeat protein
MDAAGQFVNQREQEINADLMARKARVQQEGNKNLADYQAGIAALPEAYKGYEERLKKEETGAGKEKEDAQGMAIFKAGLAMMAGSSPNAFENIGKGALAGVEDYQGALKDLKKAARERDKAFADIENARLAYKRDDLKTYQTLKDRGQERLDRVDDAMGAFSAKVLDTTASVGSNLYSKGIENLQTTQRFNATLQSNRDIANAANETHIRTAGMNSPLNLYRELGANPTGAVAKGYGAAKEEATVPQLFALYEKMKSDQTPTMGGKYTTKGEEFAARHETPQSFIKSYRAAMGQGTMSGTGQGWGNAVEVPPK